MRVIEKDAKTEEDGINAVLKEIGKDNRDLINNVEVVENTKSKLLPFKNKKVKVTVTVFEKDEKELVNLLEEFLAKMDIKVKQIDILEYDETIISLDIKTDKDSLLIGKTVTSSRIPIA